MVGLVARDEPPQKEMLIFIVPLQSPEASKDWPLVSALARRSLQSMLNQDSPEFQVFLVCNTLPLDCPESSHLTVIERDFPIPKGEAEARMADKWLKVRTGLVAVQPHAPCHTMVVDADDCVSYRLAGFVASHPDSSGWYFNRGYMHDEGSRLIYLRPHGFDGVCGTSNIVRVTAEDLPEVEVGGRDDNHILRGGHTKIRFEMESRGSPLAELPFAGAVYNLATGENHTGFSLAGWRSRKVLLQKLIRYRPLTRRVRQAFNLFDIAR